MKSRICELCGDTYNYNGKYCSNCRAYLREHPEGEYALPNKGEVVYAPNGDPICHICGRAYRKLGNHIAFRHKISQKEYRDMFKLYHSTRLSNDNYKDLMRSYVKRDYKVVVEDNLIKCGTNTRTNENNILPGKKMNKPIPERMLGDK